MKTNPNYVRWGLVVLLGAMLVTFTQCIGGSETSVDDGVSTLPSEVLVPEEDEEAPEVGVKDAERILHTMSALTGVPTSTVQNIYNSDLKAQLPSNSRVEAMLETHMMGATKLASEYCQALIENGTLRAAIWPNFDFTTGTTAAFTNDATRQYFVDTMLNQFWGTGVYDAAEYEEGALALEELILDILEGQANNATTKRNAAKAACIAALSSAQVILQ